MSGIEIFLGILVLVVVVMFYHFNKEIKELKKDSPLKVVKDGKNTYIKDSKGNTLLEL